MMPSRGTRLVRSGASRLNRLQCRNLSSTSRSTIQSLSSATKSSFSKRPISVLKSHLKPSLVASSIRYASTNSTAPATQTAPAAASTDPFPNLDTITLDNLSPDPALDTANIPEHVGYLSQIGIDYGYGVTSSIQWVLEQLHISAGLPWWAAIAMTAVTVRVVTFPFYLKSSDSMARQNALASITKPVMEEIKQAQKIGDNAAMMASWQELAAIRRRAGIRLRDQFTPMIMQAVIGFCGFRLMRSMATMPVPGLLDGGFLWLSDLTLTDGFLILPVLMAGSVHLLIRLGGESANAGAQMPPGMKNVMLYGMPGFIGLISAFQPGAVLMWFVGSGTVGIAQALLLQNAAFRNRMGLAPMYKPAPGEAAQSLLNSMLDDRKKQAGASRKSPPVMRPTYQAPNIVRQGEPRHTIDASLVNKSTQGGDDMVQPTKKGGMFQGLSERWNDVKEKAKEQARKSSQVDPQEDFKRRAANYEKDWQKAHGMRKERR